MAVQGKSCNHSGPAKTSPALQPPTAVCQPYPAPALIELSVAVCADSWLTGCGGLVCYGVIGVAFQPFVGARLVVPSTGSVWWC